jgi:hypothetical protein
LSCLAQNGPIAKQYVTEEVGVARGSIKVASVDERVSEGVVMLVDEDGTFALITAEEYSNWRARIAEATGAPISEVSLVGRRLGPGTIDDPPR